MKYINYFFLFSLLLCLSCGVKKEGFTIKGEIKDYPGTHLFVREMTPDNEVWMNDTIPVTNGCFTYTGEAPAPYLLYIIPDNYQGRYELFVENADITFSATYGDPRSVCVTGSASHDDYVKIRDKAAPLLRDYGYYRMRKSDAMKSDQALYARLADSSAFWTDRLLKFLLEQPNHAYSHVVSYFASEWLRPEDGVALEIYLDALAPETLAGVYASHAAEALRRAKTVAPGSPAYDFTLRDTSGTVYRLSDYRGKYVLLEFSASWCGWCKLEIPYLRRVHELATSRNLVMFTINLDKERAAWIADVASEALPWSVLSDLRAFGSEVARCYNITAIPVNVLIAPDGKIISTTLRGEALVDYIMALKP